MYELKKKMESVGTGPSCYKKRIYRAAVPQRLRNTALEDKSVLFMKTIAVF